MLTSCLGYFLDLHLAQCEVGVYMPHAVYFWAEQAHPVFQFKYHRVIGRLFFLGPKGQRRQRGIGR